MLKKKIMHILLTALLLGFVSVISAAGVPAETVVAEFDGGNITMGQLEARIEKIPPIYQPKYSTPEGKADLLDDLCVEELFYREALEQNVKQDKRYFSQIDIQIKSVYLGELKKDLVNKEIKFTEAEKVEYFNQHSELFPGKTYEEASAEVEQRLRPQKEQEIFTKYKTRFEEKYDVTYNEDAIMAFNLSAIDSNLVNADQVLIDSNIDDIKLTVGELVEKWDLMPDQNKMAIKTNDNLKRYLENITELELFFQEAIANGYEDREFIQETIEQIHRNMMLRTIYNRLVVDSIELDTLSLEKYYDENIELFSTNPYRKIQAFGFATKDEAKKMRKQVKKMLKKGDQEGVSKLIEEHSEYKKKDGMLDHVYNNGIIPGLGKDEVYSEYVWKTKPKKLSKVFQNSKDVWTFFHVVDNIEAVATPFDEIVTKVKKQKLKNESQANFESVSKELEEKYNLKKYPERMVVVLTAKEYFEKAESAQKRRRFSDAIFYYDKIIEHYQNNEDDYKAMFMKGFLYSEEMDDKEKARECFENVINDYPEEELHESAQFMIDEIDGKHDFEEIFESEGNENTNE
ncbi:MAG: tetratricopeptide repeat protein [Candidatus Cloacimonetes bacterium]|nr:tetratricopeptide repeat protein [Candidatus Cloacimonadota bacterium]MCF7813052.1 tetratricopeptide repeat protein [Candidatus Cloacimonadota bacterium]MCF7867207.1 tetratricopeptide repeat protein [Candidatus Cloacimonadota bacterium]MCF7882651.1 tetratricopeptide repeat protein [Candidatus Cloacimonadota bacterium]